MSNRGGPQAVRRSKRRRGIPSLDGIRAVAVALVLVSHGGIPGMQGGFIGVDVFFVLSGFLITSLLLDELAYTGRMDLLAFWRRRAKRLLPALVVMVLAVAAVVEWFPPDAVERLRDDAVAAFVWLANWNFIERKTDYFTEGGTPSPLQHTWSLGVEEQYYIVWPIALIGVAALIAVAARRRRRLVMHNTVHLAVFGVAVAGAAASAVAAVVMTSDASLNRVYFGTDTRAQALLVGAAASALLVRNWPALTAGCPVIRSAWAIWAARILPLVGLAGLGVGAHFATGSVGDFRHGMLILVAAAAVAVIAPVALDQRSPVARLLAWRPLVGLGAISYGVYLWHWPVFLVLNGERTGWSGPSLFAVRCGATVALATVSWWMIEQPVRRWRPLRVPLLPLAGATVATAIAVTVAVVPATPPDATDVSTAAAVSDPLERPVVVAQPDSRTGQVVSVFGDSVGWTLMRYLPATPGFTFVNHTLIGCGIVRGGPYRYSAEKGDPKPECDSWPDRWAGQIANDRPDVALLVVGRWETIDRMHDGRWTHVGDPAFDAYLTGELRQALNILGSTGARVVVTTEPYNRRAEKPDGSLYPEDQPDRIDRWNTLVRNVVGQYPRAALLDLNKKLCPGGAYTSKVDGIKMRSDGVHPTGDAVKWLTPWLLQGLSPK
ncbi:MAG TPA: acyltransferase family protein [Mycobacterium sp.]|nr:acyltransferase family protein [Mycobacterium sp.]